MSSFEPRPVGDAAPVEFSARRNEKATAGFVPLRIGEAAAVDEAPAAPTEDEVRQAGYDEGFAAGRAELPWQEAERLRGLIETLEKSLEEVARMRRELLRESRVRSVELALAIAEKIIRQRIATDPAPLVGIVERALETLPDEPKLRVALSSEDFDALQQGLAEEFASFGSSEAVTVEAAAELSRGDVRVHGERGAVDARVGTLLDRVREQLDALRDMPEVASDEASAEPGGARAEEGDA